MERKTTRSVEYMKQHERTCEGQGTMVTRDAQKGHIW